MSKRRTTWRTPQRLFDRLDQEFGFTLDVCADHSNAMCDRYFTPEDNGLLQRWDGVCWMNPPYGREIANWIQKAWRESRRGATVVCLLPARTDVGWWHDYAMHASEIRFIRGRLTFAGAPHNAPFPSVIVVFRGEEQQRYDSL